MSELKVILTDFKGPSFHQICWDLIWKNLFLKMSTEGIIISRIWVLTFNSWESCPIPSTNHHFPVHPVWKKIIIIIHAEYKNASLVVINTCHSLGTMEHLIATRPRTCPGKYSNRPRRGTVRDHRKTPINPVRITPQQCALAVCVPCIVRQVYCLFHSWKMTSKTLFF